MPHLKVHFLKYIWLIIFVLVLAGFYLYRSEASSTPTFQRYIGGAASTPTRVRVQGLSYPQSIVIDSQDNKYFTTDCCTIQKYDANDNFVLSFGSYGTTSDKFSYIADMVVDQQGNIYVTDNGYDSVLNRSIPSVKKFDSNGNFVLSFGTYGTGDGQLEYACGIGIEPSTGNIYVGNAFYTKRNVQIYSPSGVFISQFGSQGDADGLFQNPCGITFDRNGDVHVVDYSKRRIQRFASTTQQFMSVFGMSNPNFVDGGFYHPTNMVMDSKGDFWVSDAGQNRVQKFSSSTYAFISKFGLTGSADGQIDNGGGGIAIDSQDDIYVAESNNRRISKFDPQGNFIKKYETKGSVDGDFDTPVGVAIDSNKNSYIADANNYRVQKFDSSGNFVSKFGTNGTGDGQFGNINGVAVDTNNNVYVIDATTTIRIQKFDSSGNFLLKFGTNGSGNGQLSGPSAIAIDHSTNNVYISDTLGGNARVAVFSQDGNFIRNFGGPGTGNGQFDKPMGITVTPQGYVYVFNQNNYDNYHIQKFNLDGTFVTKQTFPYSYEPGGPYTGLSLDGSNVYMTSDSGGNLYFADYYNVRVVKLDSNMQFVSLVSTIDKKFNPTGVDVDSSGAIYMTDIYGNSALIYAPTPLLLSSISSSVSTSSASISWTSSLPASSIVEYGPSTAFGTSTPETNTSPMVTSHSIIVNSLPPCSTFVYRVKSTNSYAVTTISATSTFTTTGCTNMTTIISSVQIQASSTATSTVSNGVVSVVVPPGVSATSTNIVFQANKIDSVVFFAAASAPVGKSAIGTEVFHLVAIDASSTNLISTFSKPVIVSLTYSPSGLNGTDPNALSIYRYDGSAWYTLTDCTTNTSTFTVSCYTTSFSDFALFATPIPTTSTISTNTGGGGIILPINAQVSDSGPVKAVIDTTVKAATSTTVKIPTQQIVNTNTTSSLRSLYRGIRGDDVASLQTFLSTNYPQLYPQKLVTGYFGRHTFAAIKKLQCVLGIVCDGDEFLTGWGVVGKETRSKALQR